MKLICLTVAMLMLSACADLSMYNQTPAPIGQRGQARNPSATQTYPLESTNEEHRSAQYDNAEVFTTQTQNPAVVALLDDANQQTRQGGFDSAVSKLERAIRISPRDAYVWSQLAQVRHEQHKYELAISLAKKSNLLAGDNKALQRRNWLLIALSYDGLGASASARQARINATR